MGADVQRTYPDTIEVEGKRRLRGADHAVMPDRIEAGTFAIAAGVTGGHVILEGADCDIDGRARRGHGQGRPRGDLRPGSHGDRRARGRAPAASSRSTSTTGPYPELATDIQPPTTVLLTQAKGDSKVHESIFEDRLEWTARARKMGAKIELKGPQRAIVHGPAKLRAADVEISDLRAGASLILGALAADGHLVDRRRAPRPARV